jgi:hypothetical protein
MVRKRNRVPALALACNEMRTRVTDPIPVRPNLRVARHTATEGYKFREGVSRELLNAYERGLGKHYGVTRERS